MHPPQDAAARVLEYHERSKHRLDRYAPGPGSLDWASQPNPFREFDGAARLQLPLAADALGSGYGDVRAGRLPPPADFDLRHVAMLFELSFGLSAWKAYGGNRWALRCNPSSGNLHPTEAYLVCPALDGIAAGIHHYVSRDHVLERRAIVEDGEWNAAFAANGFLVGVTSIYWREAWKYGMRAWRYCQHDCGHAIAAVSYAAAALGWQARVVEPLADTQVANLLGLDREGDFASVEREAPDVMIWVGDPGHAIDGARLQRGLASATWQGRANRLSVHAVGWPDIDRVHGATMKPRTEEPPAPSRPRAAPSSAAHDPSFATLARQRRSAVDFDATTRLSASAFVAMLECLMPRADAPPWNAVPWTARVHPVLFVHRVDDFVPGLYVLMRDEDAIQPLRDAMRKEWLWEKAGPDHVPLYLLLPHDLRDAARMVSCHQDIAADSCFALGMLADFHAAAAAPWHYRQLFWECGMLGHVLYLEAEAAGVRGTGIGCFFDDEMHSLLGITGHRWQSLYHFTVGGAVEDRRLSTLPAYR